MFDYVLNTHLSLIVNEVWVDVEPTSLIRTKNQRKFKALLNSPDVVNMEERTKDVLVMPRSRSRETL